MFFFFILKFYEDSVKDGGGKLQIGRGCAMIGQTERDDKGVEAQFMKKKILVLLVCSMLTLPTTVSADILDYEGTVNAYKQDNKTLQTFEIDNGSGEKVTAVAKSDKVSVSAKATYIRSMPGKNGKKLARVYLGTGVERVGGK